MPFRHINYFSRKRKHKIIVLVARPGDDPDTPSKLVEAVVNKSSNMMVCSHHKPLTLEQRSEMGGQANFSLIPKVQDKTELRKDIAAVTEKEEVARNNKIGAQNGHHS